MLNTYYYPYDNFILSNTCFTFYQLIMERPSFQFRYKARTIADQTGISISCQSMKTSVECLLHINITDDCIQEVMLRCLQVPSITTVGPTVTEKLT